jgi:hypothetical protein
MRTKVAVAGEWRGGLQKKVLDRRCLAARMKLWTAIEISISRRRR